MRLKSTGLGATELSGDLTGMKKSLSGVFMDVKIKKPVVWRVRVFLQPQDLRAIVWRALMPRNLWIVIKTLLSSLRPLKRHKTISKNSGFTNNNGVKNET